MGMISPENSGVPVSPDTKTNTSNPTTILPANTSTSVDPNLPETKFVNPTNGQLGGLFATPEGGQIWYRIKGIPVKQQRNFVRPMVSTVIPNDKGTVYTFAFLGPLETAETLAHDWQPYEGLQQAVQQLWGNLGVTSMEQVKAVAAGLNIDLDKKIDMGNIGNGIGSLLSQSRNEGFWKTLGSAVSTGLGREKPVPWRVDTPLVYKNTERRTFELVFNLISTEGNPFKEVVMPVRTLMSLSSPMKDVSTDSWNPLVQTPYVFEILTSPQGARASGETSYPLLNVPFAALMNINPVWRGPYSMGHPTRCELRLSFKEIEPVYSVTFDWRKKVIVIDDTGGAE